MKHEIVWYKRFERALRKVSKRNKLLEEKIYSTIELIAENPFDKRLNTHKLTGILEGHWSSSVEFDCRIIFVFRENLETGIDYIVLSNIGTHDEVY